MNNIQINPATQNPIIDVWLTTEALTRGIFKIKAEHFVKLCPVMVVQRLTNTQDVYHYKPHWHFTLAEALARVEEMRDMKIDYFAKEIQKLAKMKFEKVTDYVS